jgi:hypothetical protein
MQLTTFVVDLILISEWQQNYVRHEFSFMA